MEQLRIGVISSINTRPLIRGLENSIEGDYELVYANPSSLADQLRYGELDAALIPSVEFLRGVGNGFVPGICVAGDGPIESVRLLSNQPLENLEQVLVDRGSRVGVAMLRLLLDHNHQINPDFHSFRPHPEQPLLGPDGKQALSALITGDQAMSLIPEVADMVIDLGEWWRTSFKQPFVYALWVYRGIANSERTERLISLLTESYRVGIRELPLICEEIAAERGLAEMRVHEYLTTRVDYNLTAENLEGLREFHRLCVESYLANDRETVRQALMLQDAATGSLKI
ncbi:MAG: menaquinone biosynthesis protein [bacterium]|nr:menaquinone biosynthesis protein [bacterium]